MNLSQESPYRSWAERNGFSDWALALIWIVVSFVLFQVAGTVISLVLLISRTGTDLPITKMLQSLTDNLDLVFIGNTVGQILFLGLATWLFSRLSVSKKNRAHFFGYESHANTGRIMLLVVGLMVALQPFIWFLGWLNAMMPISDSLKQLEQVQNTMIEDYLKGDHYVWLTLFHVSVVPAVCEETLYRGYILRVFQKDWGIWPAIIASGLLFGIYHMRLTQLAPLALIGMILAYIAYSADSIYPAMVGHLVNNGGSVLLAYYFPDFVFSESTPDSMPPVWLVALSLALSGLILYLIYNERQQRAEKQQVSDYV